MSFMALFKPGFIIGQYNRKSLFSDDFEWKFSISNSNKIC
jgi:hypothetical protein